jgi:hypothetical protein
MARQLGPAELSIGGIAAMQAIHAVTDIANTAHGHDRELIGRFRALVAMAIEHRDRHGASAMRAALTRLLFTTTHTLRQPVQVRPGVTATPPDIEAVAAELTRDQAPEVQRLMRMCAASRALPAFVRSIGEGADIISLGLAAAVVLREVLALRAGKDPMRRWVITGQVANNVIAAHYLQGTSGRIPV